ncbi:MAG: ABC-three component system middle component 2 [Hyphomicrobiales bacterium]|nr:ABC-three component system middle component 2 [Hyphomicrobiales bacterium]
METLKDRSGRTRPTLFNNEIETAIRSLYVLDAMFPRRCGVAELTWFDYAIVNSGEFTDAPPSLHPIAHVSNGELLVRRHLIGESLRLLRVVHLADEFHDECGIRYSAAEEAPAFLEMLTTAYSLELKNRAVWVAQRFAAMAMEQIEVEIAQTIGRWTSELQETTLPIRTML